MTIPFFVLLVRTFEVTVIFLVSDILKDKDGQSVQPSTIFKICTSQAYVIRKKKICSMVKFNRICMYALNYVLIIVCKFRSVEEKFIRI